MNNWNYELARNHADSVPDVITRRMTQLFLTKFVFLAVQRYAVPENGEVDLLCYVKIIEKIVSHQDMIKRCSEGEDLDSGWKAIGEEFERTEKDGQ
jgi:hypothetical protein